MFNQEVFEKFLSCTKWHKVTLWCSQSIMTVLQKIAYKSLVMLYIITKFWIQSFYQLVFFQLEQVLYLVWKLTDCRPHFWPGTPKVLQGFQRSVRVKTFHCWFTYTITKLFPMFWWIHLINGGRLFSFCLSSSFTRYLWLCLLHRC